MDAETARLARIADPTRRAEAFTAAMARRKQELVRLMSCGGGMAGLGGALLAATHECTLRYRSMEHAFRYLQRLQVRRVLDGRRLFGAYPLRDLRREVLPVLSSADWSRPSMTGQRYAYALVEPFCATGLRCRARAALYAQLSVRRLVPEDLQSPEERDLVGQWGVFARQDIPAGTCLGIYGGLVLSNTEAPRVWDRRYLMRVGTGPEPLHLDGETLLCLANSRFVLDARGEVVGHPEDGYNAELARFPAVLAHGYELVIPALFACADIPAGVEVRWNYGLFRKDVAAG